MILRRARRLLVGGVVGGALVVIDRRRRRSATAPSDALAAFESAPCFPRPAERTPQDQGSVS